MLSRRQFSNPPLILFVVLPILIGLAWPRTARASEEIWSLLKKPGQFVLLRHSNAPGDVPESNDMNFKDCSIQRNLDAEGRAQAGRIGDAFRKRGIKATLIASQYCRAIDTARLMKLGPVKVEPLLNLVHIGNLFAMREASAKTAQFMKSLPKNQLTVMVTHIGNILAVAGANVSSGEMAVVHLDRSGAVVLDGKIMVP
jgi:phosphohistidine phosphatase SixA